MAAGDALNEANDQVRAGKRSTLAAMAQHGSQGVADLAASQRAIGDAQAQALGQLTAGAQSRNAPAAAMGQLQDIASQPYNLSQQYLGSAQTSYQADAARLASAHGNYMDEAAAAVPVIRADADARIGVAKEEWERRRELEELEQQMAREKHQWALEEHEAQMKESGDFLGLPQYLQEAMAGGVAAMGSPEQVALQEELEAGAPAQREAKKQMGVLEDRAAQEKKQKGKVTEETATALEAARVQAREYGSKQEQARDYDPNSVEAMASAYESLGVNPAMALGLAQASQPDVSDQVATNAAMFDQRAQQEGFRNYEDMQAALGLNTPGGEDTRPAGILRPDEAAGRLEGFDNRLVQEITASDAYADAIATVEDYLGDDEAVPWAEVDDVLAEHFDKKFGHDYGRTRELVREMYADKFR